MISGGRHEVAVAPCRVVALTAVLTTLAFSPVSAQERCSLSWGIQPANTTYTQQYAIDVGDVPGHQVRIFEIYRRFPNDTPNCEGLKRNGNPGSGLPLITSTATGPFLVI